MKAYHSLIVTRLQLSESSLIWLQLGRNLYISDPYLTQVCTLPNELYHISSVLGDQRRHTNLNHHHHYCHHSSNRTIPQDFAKQLNGHLAAPRHQNYNG